MTLPLACTLAPGQLADRREQIAALGRDALVDAHAEGTRGRLRFERAAGIRERLDALVEAESRCCAFLTMRITESPDALVLAVEGPAGAEPVVAGLVDAFIARRSA